MSTGGCCPLASIYEAMDCYIKRNVRLVTISPLRRVCSDTTPFIAVLIEAATGADMRPHSVDNDVYMHEMIRTKPRAHLWRG